MLGKMDEIAHRDGRTVLFVTHNMTAARAFCAEGLVLERGKIAFSGGIDGCVEQYNSAIDRSVSTEWVRAPDKKRGVLSVKRVTIELLGGQPNHILRIVCSLEGRPPHNPAMIAFDIADQLGTVLMQVLPSLNPFISADKSEQKFCFDVHLPPLVPGRYFITTWVGPHHAETYDICRECLVVEIMDSPTKGRVLPHTADHGFLVPNCTVTPLLE